MRSISDFDAALTVFIYVTCICHSFNMLHTIKRKSHKFNLIKELVCYTTKFCYLALRMRLFVCKI